MKFDLHVHTCYSYDAVTTLREIIVYSKKRGLDGVAITDHDTITGALQLIHNREIIVIPGIEVSTLRGHILALNVMTSIPSNMSPIETIQRIHEAGGIVVAPHPTTIFKSALGLQTVSALNFDAIEVMNSTAFPYFISTHLNLRLANQLNLPKTAGSDSHMPCTIGRAYTFIDANPDVEEVVQAIKRGATIPHGKAVSLVSRFKKAFLTRNRRTVQNSQ